jgi:hypothetical protein
MWYYVRLNTVYIVTPNNWKLKKKPAFLLLLFIYSMLQDQHLIAMSTSQYSNK